MKLYKGYWYYIHFADSFLFEMRKVKNKERAYELASIQPIYIEPSDKLTELRDRALPKLYEQRDTLAKSVQDVAKCMARFVKESE